MLIGEYLKDILRKKDLSMAEITKRAGIKHRNILYRLFNDELSVGKTSQIVSDIKKVISFSDTELKIIDELLEQGNKGTFYVKTREILSNLYKEKLPCCFSVYLNGEYVSFYDMLCTNFADEMTIYLYNIDNVRIIGDIYKFLSNNKNVKIYHILQFQNQNLMTAYEILAVLELSHFDNYIPMQGKFINNTRVCALKRRNNKYYISQLEKINKEYIAVDSEIGGGFYDYLKNKQKVINSMCKKLKFQMARITDYVYFLQTSLNFDRNDSVYSEGTLCFGYLPADIICEMFVDIDCFGFPIEHEIPQQLMASVRERQKLLYESSNKKRFLFDINRFENMIKTGYAVGHFYEFKPMTIEQRKLAVGEFLKYIKANPKNINVKFLKDLSIRSPFAYQINGMLWENCWKYHKPSEISVLLIENQTVDDIMNDFIDFVWDECTFSCEESVELIKSLLEKWLDY